MLGLQGNIIAGFLDVSFVSRVLARSILLSNLTPYPGALMGVHKTFYIVQDDGDVSPAHKRQKPKPVHACEECSAPAHCAISN